MAITPGADIAAVVDRLRPGAAWRDASSYARLQATWTDGAAIPTEQEINDEWTILELERAKSDKFDEVDAKVEELLGDGFPHAGKTFPMGLSDRLNWIAGQLVKDHATLGSTLFSGGGLGATCYVSGVAQEHVFADSTAYDAWFVDGATWMETIIAVARGLKVAAANAADLAAVAAVDVAGASWPS